MRVHSGHDGWLTVACALSVLPGLSGATVVQAPSTKVARVMAQMVAEREKFEIGMKVFLPKFQLAPLFSQKNSCQR